MHQHLRPDVPVAYRCHRRSNVPIAYICHRRSDVPIAFRCHRRPDVPVAYRCRRRPNVPSAYRCHRRSMCLLLTDVIGVPMCLFLKDIDVLMGLFAVYRCHRRIFRTQKGEWKTLRKLDEKTKKNDPLRHFKETDAEFKRALWSILHSLIFLLQGNWGLLEGGNSLKAEMGIQLCFAYVKDQYKI